MRIDLWSGSFRAACKQRPGGAGGGGKKFADTWFGRLRHNVGDFGGGLMSKRGTDMSLWNCLGRRLRPVHVNELAGMKVLLCVSDFAFNRTE